MAAVLLLLLLLLEAAGATAGAGAGAGAAAGTAVGATPAVHAFDFRRAAPAVEAGYKGVLMLLAGLLAFAMVRHLRPAEGASQPAQRLYSIAPCKRELV